GDQERAGRLHTAQRGREHLGGEVGGHHGDGTGRKNPAVRTGEQQGVPPSHVLPHAGRREAPVTHDERLFAYLLRLGHSDLVLAQRLGEWTGHGPVLEEDIALTNVGLDLLVQGRLWFAYAGEVEARFSPSGRTEDQLAFLRDSGEFRNLLLVEQ